MDNIAKVEQKLNEMNIPYKIVYHEAAYKVGDLSDIAFEYKEEIVKNLFLKDAKGSRHFLVVVQKDKRADLKKLRRQLGTGPLSFASEERLEKYLKLTRGAVSPFGIMNDTEREVEVVFDKDLVEKEILGVHPNDNTASIFLSFADIKRIVEDNGNSICYAEI